MAEIGVFGEVDDVQAIPNSWWQTARCAGWLTCALVMAQLACGSSSGDHPSAPAVGITEKSAAGGDGVEDERASDTARTNATGEGGKAQELVTAPANSVGAGGATANGGLALGGSTADSMIATKDAPATVALTGATGTLQTSGGTTSADTLAGGATSDDGEGTRSASAAMSLGGAGAATTRTETVLEVIRRFCDTQDVSLCDPRCYENRKTEADQFKSCNEFYKALMLCQLATPNRTCVNQVVVSGDRCLVERNAYKTCVGM
ncbi:MAG TPA: hypothetical protein VIV60_04955 [Polyangiaceae bacterium]